MGFLWDFYKWGAQKPPLSGKAARRNAGTERLQQIYDDLSVTFGDSFPERGAKGGVRAPRSLPLIGEAFYPKKQGAAFAAPCRGYVGN